MEKDLDVVSRRVGLPRNLYDDLKEIKAKGDIRPRDARPDVLLDESQRQLVSILCRKEIEAFGYMADAERRPASVSGGYTKSG